MARRPHPLNRDAPASGSASAPGRTPPASFGPPILAAIVIALAQACWLVWWLIEPLPSLSAPLRRFDLLLRALPAVVPGVRWSESHLGQAVGHLAHPVNLLDRLPILAASLLVAAASVAAGSAILRAVGFGRSNRWERLALAFGAGSIALGTVAMVAGSTVGLTPSGVRLALGLLIVTGIAGAWRSRPSIEAARPRVGEALSMLGLAGPFLVIMLLGALLPTIEFDALEYHLQAPKEFFLAGRVDFLPHNAYASMPLGVEMLTLLAMESTGDWWLGALAGQELIAWFAPASAILIGSAAASIAGDRRAGWLAAILYLSTPWVVRVANTPFVEGPLGFAHAALIWLAVRRGTRPDLADQPRRFGPGFLIGLLAGGAMAMKYPGLVSAVVPATAYVLVVAYREGSIRVVAGFGAGLAASAGPWLVKNLLETRNPVYPLAWSVFGGIGWDATFEGRWRQAHGPRPITLPLLVRSALDVLGRSDWQSGLFAAFAPLAWLGSRGGGKGRGALAILAALALFLFIQWWCLTHRLDRFWLPILAPLAILAGVGASRLFARSKASAIWAGLILLVGVAANLTLSSTELCGPVDWDEPIADARARAMREGTPGLSKLDAVLPGGARPLIVGQAGTFGVRPPLAYNTVFNPDLLESWTKGVPPDRIAEVLRGRRITHVYVDWNEIRRYRQPGNYGFTDYENEDLFDRWVEAGALRPPVSLGPGQVLYQVPPASRRPAR